MALSALLVAELTEVPDAVAQRQGVGVVKHADLVLLAEAGSAQARVLLVQPGALDIGLTLGIVLLVINLTCQVREGAQLLCINGPSFASAGVVLRRLERGLGLAGAPLSRLTEVGAVLGVKVTCAMVGRVVGDHCAEASFGAGNIPVLQGQVSDVVLVDHAQDWLLSDHVDLRLLEVIGL